MTWFDTGGNTPPHEPPATGSRAAKCNHAEHLHGCPGDCWTRPHTSCPSGCKQVWNAKAADEFADDQADLRQSVEEQGMIGW